MNKNFMTVKLKETLLRLLNIWVLQMFKSQTFWNGDIFVPDLMIYSKEEL